MLLKLDAFGFKLSHRANNAFNSTGLDCFIQGISGFDLVLQVLPTAGIFPVHPKQVRNVDLLIYSVLV